MRKDKVKCVTIVFLINSKIFCTDGDIGGNHFVHMFLKNKNCGHTHKKMLKRPNILQNQ